MYFGQQSEYRLALVGLCVSHTGGGADVTTAELEGMLDSDVSYRWHFRDGLSDTPLQAFFRGRWKNEREEYDRKRR